MKKIFLLLCGLFCLCVSCKRGLTLKVDNGSIGKASEVLVVMNKSIFGTIMEDSIRTLLAIPQPGINQIEGMFDALVLDEQFFNSDKQRHYNIVQFTLTNDTISPICTIDHGVWTHPQIYVQIKAHTPDEALTCFIEHQIEICNALYDNDIAKIQGAYEKILNVELQRRIKEKFGILLTVTKDYNVAREGDDFLWLAYRTAVNDRFIMIYRSDSTILTRESLINNRNRICRQYIEGEKDNIHPIVTQLASLPYVQPIQLGKKVGMEMRGLWETENDYMGGPFYHFSYVNDYGKCISVDGFVYAPNESKRDYIRQVEAIVKSVK